MPIIINNISQGTDEWIAAKLGKPSASNISKIITNGGLPSKQSEGYMYELAGEIITGRREESYKSQNMEVGNEREAESRSLFEMMNDVSVEQVGVVYKDDSKRFLCSPDGIINRSYGLELKNVLPKTQVKYLLDGWIPDEYFGQVQMSLYVTGYPFWMFMSYVPAMKPLIIKVFPDEKYIAKLDVLLNEFCDELEKVVSKIK